MNESDEIKRDRELLQLAILLATTDDAYTMLYDERARCRFCNALTGHKIDCPIHQLEQLKSDSEK